MDHGPASRTRSSTSQILKEKVSGIQQFDSPLNQDSSQKKESLDPVFKTPKSNTRTRRYKKNRTPIGQILSTSVEDIRNFFQQDKTISEGGSDAASISSHRQLSTSSKKITQVEWNLEHSDSALNTWESQSTSHLSTKLQGLIIDEAASANITDTIPQSQLTHCATMQTSLLSEVFMERSKRHETINQKIIDYQKHLDDIKVKKEQAMAKLLQQQTEEQQAQETGQEKTDSSQEEQSDQDIEKMETKLVLQMFQELKKEFRMGSINDGENRMLNTEAQQSELLQELRDMSQELMDCKVKNQILVNTVTRMSDIITEMNQRITNLELNNMKRSIMVMGFHLSRRKQDCIAALVDFMYTEMEIQPNIQEIFFLSTSGTSPLVMTMETMEDKIEVFKNSHKIRDLVNSREEGYFFNDYLPANLNELK